MNSASHLAWPFFDEAHRVFKTQLQEWTSKQFADQHGHDESREAIEAEAQAQAICMVTNDFHRAYHAFVAKQTPVFEGN